MYKEMCLPSFQICNKYRSSDMCVFCGRGGTLKKFKSAVLSACSK